MRTKDLIPGKPESMYEIGYMILERKSIFIISGIILLNMIGIVTVYFLIIGNTCASLFADISSKSVGDNFWVDKSLYILVTALLLLPVVCMRELQELKSVSVSLFVAICVFILILLWQLIDFGTQEFTTAEERLTFAELSGPYKETSFWNIMSAVNNCLIAFMFQMNLFPIFSALSNKTNEQALYSTKVSIFTIGLLYSILGIACLFLFGSLIDTLAGSDVMQLIYAENTLDRLGKKHPEAYVLRALFIVVLFCHIPFLFFGGKEAALVIVDEINRRSVSNLLKQRMVALNMMEKMTKEQTRIRTEAASGKTFIEDELH